MWRQEVVYFAETDFVGETAVLHNKKQTTLELKSFKLNYLILLHKSLNP